MAVVTRKSTAIANRDASPTVSTMAAYDGGTIKEKEGYITAANGDSVGSYYPMASVPSNSRISSIVLQSEALGAGATVNCGVYAPTQSIPALAALGFAAGSAVNAAFFASALSVAAAVASTEIINQSGSNTLNLQEQELWQALGLASDPGCNLDIGLAMSAATAAAGRIGVKIKYVF